MQEITITVPDEVYNRWVLAEAKESYKPVLPNLTRNPLTIEQHAEYRLAMHIAKTAASLDVKEKIDLAKHDFATMFAQAVLNIKVKVKNLPGPPS